MSLPPGTTNFRVYSSLDAVHVAISQRGSARRNCFEFNSAIKMNAENCLLAQNLVSKAYISQVRVLRASSITGGTRIRIGYPRAGSVRMRRSEYLNMTGTHLSCCQRCTHRTDCAFSREHCRVVLCTATTKLRSYRATFLSNLVPSLRKHKRQLIRFRHSFRQESR